MTTDRVRGAVVFGYVAGVGPGLLIVVAAGWVAWVWLGPAASAFAAILGAVASWPLWALAISRWRRWAVGAGISPQDLQTAAVAVGLVGPKDSRLAQAERTATIPLFWGLIAGGLLICTGLGLELSGASGQSVHMVTTIGYLAFAAGIALDAGGREPLIASWVGLTALLIAAGVEWLFLGSGMSLWLWVPIKTIPAIVGVFAILVLAWTPVRKRTG
jgi:hypothetical protein